MRMGAVSRVSGSSKGDKRVDIWEACVCVQQWDRTRRLDGGRGILGKHGVDGAGTVGGRLAIGESISADA